MSKSQPQPLSLPRYAFVDLTTGEVRPLPVSEEQYRLYVGGKALAARLLYDLLPAGTDPLAPEALVVINTGAMNGSGAPSTSRFNLTFKNVMTGGIASTNCGGSFGFSLRKAGFEGLVIGGCAAEPVYLEIADGEIFVRSAVELWGLEIGAAAARAGELVQERSKSTKGVASLMIGPSGENLVRYAGVASGDRIAARCGGGAVFGSKRLKGLVCWGKQPIPVYDNEKFKAFMGKWVKFIRQHPMTGDAMGRYGSAGIVNRANASLALPTRNFQCGFFAEADAVSGETMTETRLESNKGCVSCPIRCERRVRLVGAAGGAGSGGGAGGGSGDSAGAGGDGDSAGGDGAGDAVAAGGAGDALAKIVKGPEYETLGLFGPNIGNADLDAIIEINHLCDELGLDTISCAGTIAFAMELAERGGEDFGLRFGDAQGVIAALPKIARREGKLGELANGSKWLADKYGGSAGGGVGDDDVNDSGIAPAPASSDAPAPATYAIHSKGLELAAYEPRRSAGMGLGCATANRGGCHIGGGYVSLLESINILAMAPTGRRGKAQWTVFLQDGLDAVSAVGSCIFSSLTFIPRPFYALGPHHWLIRAVNRILSVSGPVMTLLVRLAPTPLLRFDTMLLFPYATAARHVTGLPLYTGSFIELGERCFNLERMFNLREGLTGADDTLPERLTKEPQLGLKRGQNDDKDGAPTPANPTSEGPVVPLQRMLRTYYRVRGWDRHGVPKARKLARLRIEV
ncbi:MAG: aldehyde:ferredoxin oxidoreductase [Coriobacteriia bacterium]|nr:aldehyde:ferredoxin oxidoreductase [Coriobacteriia bacterium]